ncbi:MAG TPA: hypothetical protein PKE59_00220 [Novosphingobium sp.]|jgi:hypothetical protein|nr:hypothetical protein [Novosphingobium sp.]
MSAFAAANDMLFEDQNLSVAALWKDGGAGAGLDVRIVISAPDREIDWRETRLVTGTVIIEVRSSEVAEVSMGDTFTVGSTVYAVNGDPKLDDQHLTWRAEAS